MMKLYPGPPAAATEKTVVRHSQKSIARHAFLVLDEDQRRSRRSTTEEVMVPDVEEPVPKAVFDSLQKSGFPFQTAIAHVISCAGKRWEIHASEYPWRSLDNDD